MCEAAYNPPKDQLKQQMLHVLGCTQNRLNDKAKGVGCAVVKIEIETKASIWNYQCGQQKEFLKIYTSLPTLVTPCKCALLVCACAIELRTGRSAAATLRCLVLLQLLL